ncbi:MAG: class I SAM-dependent methyltransferase [Calditrichaeota bacterium]|nr:class I SAM-dependent methyltransferase [Calditrichota bacterium]
MTSKIKNNFWEDAKQVERFAAREPDNRLQKLVKQYDNPQQIRVLDLGCAGGRNTVFLCKLGFDVWAVDASHSMIKETKSRLKRILPTEALRERIIHGVMSDLSWAADDFFDLLLALGIYHNAHSEGEFRTTLRETARVTTTGGLALVANFAPGFAPEFQELKKIENSKFVYEHSANGNMCLLTADELDAEMEAVGFYPLEKSETVHHESETGRRVTVNALYKKR